MSESFVPSTCLLVIGDRVALRANAPPEAEYALFEIGDIELRATEPGRVREHGYQTTAEEARGRLATLGLTPGIAREIAGAMQPVLSVAYARGVAVKRVAHCLGPGELFQSETYDGASRTYRGVFLDLATLAQDLRLEHAAATFHALYLATLLDVEAPATSVTLTTDACTKGAKPGARTYKRPVFADARRLRETLGELAVRAPRPAIHDALPRADVIAFLRERADAATSEDARRVYTSLEATVSLRDAPEKGPLAEPELWAIETRIETGDLDGLVEAIDQAEQRHGRTPGTTYLRARSALALRLEPSQTIAERVSALALSMSSFQELALLAAEAWLDADDPRRALPFARDLVDAPGLDEGLLLRAQRLVARSVGAAPARAPSLEVPRTLPSMTPAAAARQSGASISAPRLDAPALSPPIFLEPPDLDLVIDTGRHAPTPSAPAAAPAPAPAESSRGNLHPQDEIVRIPANVRPAAMPSARPPRTTTSKLPRAARSTPPVPIVERSERLPERSDHRLEPPPMPHEPAPPRATAPPTLEMPVIEHTASFTIDLPGPEQAPPRSVPPPQSSPRPSRRPRLSGVMMETKPPASFDPRAEPDSLLVSEPMTTQPRPITRPPAGPPRRSSPAPARRPSAPTSTEPRSSMHGASLPPFERENPAPVLPRLPRAALPKFGAEQGELAEQLALPPGVGGQPRAGEPLPPAVLEIRVQFTQLSRELGRDYRLKHGIELRADVSGIEAMQSVLLETFPDHTVTTKEQTSEIRRHGAFLSEILVRALEAQWLDIVPDELGYWAMIVPPDTRVWPFGRVARFVSMGHKERDLVSYFLELESRARRP